MILKKVISVLLLLILTAQPWNVVFFVYTNPDRRSMSGRSIIWEEKYCCHSSSLFSFRAFFNWDSFYALEQQQPDLND